MCHTGYNVEDAVIVNRGALERGILEQLIIILIKHMKVESMMGMKIETKFMDTNNDNVLETKEGYDYSHLIQIGTNKRRNKVGGKLVIGMGTNSFLNQVYMLIILLKLKRDK